MIVGIILLWILTKLSAPVWCFWLVGIKLFICFIVFCVKLVKIGKELEG